MNATATLDLIIIHVCMKCHNTVLPMFNNTYCPECHQIGYITDLHIAPEGMRFFVLWPWTWRNGEKYFSAARIEIGSELHELIFVDGGIEIVGPFTCLEAAQADVDHPSMFDDDTNLAEEYVRSQDLLSYLFYGGA